MASAEPFFISAEIIMNKTILFDLDGTLIDSTSAILKGFDAAFLAHDKKVPDHDTLKSLVGYPLEIMFEKLGADKNLLADYVKEYKACYEKIYLDETVLLPHAMDALKEASTFADVGVVTTKTSKFSIILLEHLGVMKFIKTVVGRDDVVNPKPDPEPINLALKRLDKEKDNAFMVGDTIMDLKAAKAALIMGVGLTCGYGKESDLRQFSEHIFANPHEAVSFIKEA